MMDILKRIDQAQQFCKFYADGAYSVETAQWNHHVNPEFIEDIRHYIESLQLKLMHLQTQQAEPVTREGFEKWAKFAAQYMDISRFEDGYSDCNTDYAWAGWQAALAQPQQQAAPPQRKELSASEILNMMPSGIPAEYDGELMKFARAVEAKLKERNGY